MANSAYLARLNEKRSALTADLDRLRQSRRTITQTADREFRDALTDGETAQFREVTSQIEHVEQQLEPLAARIADLEAEEARGTQLGAVQHAPAASFHVREARTYTKGNGRSYLQDLVRVQLNMDGDGESRQRLQRHAQDVSTGSEYRDLNRTDGNGGQFVPPAWLVSEYVDLARAGRAYANLCSRDQLPTGTDSINIPKVATGTSVAIQTADNAAVSETDLTDESITAPVRTIAGQQDVAVQLLDQSPISFDQVVFRDLIADHATKTDQQVISGSGSSGQVTGVRSTSGITTITYTSATPTVAQLYSKVADAVQRIHTQRFAPPTCVVMHPRRWAYLLAATDNNGRPLVVPSAGNPQNAIATLGAVAAEMVVGQMHGLPVITDPSMPTALGAGTNQDVIHVLRASDLLLWESGIRTRVLPDVGSGTLTVRLQVYSYLAFTAERYPASVVEVGGSGMTSPAF